VRRAHDRTPTADPDRPDAVPAQGDERKGLDRRPRWRQVGRVRQEEIWDAQAAEGYDTPGTGMFSAGVLQPTVDRLVELAGDGAALELAIGTGRVAVPLLERGVRVVGIELSPPMLARLRQKVDEAALPVALGDMSSTQVAGRFSVVYLVFNTIANLLTQDEQVACFRNAARHLRPGGCFVVELWVPELRALAPGRAGTVGAARPGYLAVDTYDVVTQHVISHHFEFDGGREARLFRTPHRYVWPSELDLMGRLAGFDLESRHADWTGSAFTVDSPSHVSVYRLRPPSSGPAPT
jgi:SAM-dependent methyltransferase